MCGGAREPASQPVGKPGLSPRVRGSLRYVACSWPWYRSIPACAGEPSMPEMRLTMHPVYPRVCGGARRGRFAAGTGSGLSPRVRGSLMPKETRKEEGGSIPACAGEPRCVPRAALPRGVYPRVCGGAELDAAGADGPRGLSPRVRGSRLHRRFRARDYRSIPACAGEPHWRNDCGFVVRVYPRVCGGATIRIDAEDLEKGLSPRVRGSRSMGVAIVRRNGSIPACAGEPTAGGPGGKSGRVYPRVCGGATIRSTHCGPSKGLSPRVRGSRSVAGQHARHRGSIPACAGEPPTWTR